MFDTLAFSVLQVDKWKVSTDDVIKFSLRIVHFLLPWLKEFHQDQMLEKRIEASIQGIITAMPFYE
jgi:lysine-specific demethylase 3